MKKSRLYQLFQQYPVVVTDTRNLIPNSIFFALKGEQFNGNHFAQIAIENGCKYAVIDEEEYCKNENFILVNDALRTLQDLAKEHRRNLGIPLLAITGTNGKTTSKELIQAVLSQKFNSFATQGNYNNHIGVPLSLLSMASETEFGIVEMGANHPKEIKALCEIAEPDFGIITNVGKAHLEGFGSFEGVKKTKKELYDYLQKKGTVFVNIENQNLQEMLNTQKVFYYGNTQKANTKAKLVTTQPYLVVELMLPKLGNLYIKTKLIGSYNFENVLAAIAVGQYFSVEETKIKKALEAYMPNNNRSQLKKTTNNLLFLDAYNANPSSMKAAIDNFATLQAKHKLMILGDMLELGAEAEKEHVALLKLIEKNDFNKIFLVGEIFSQLTTAKNFKTFHNVSELKAHLKENKITQHSILMKGSRKIGLEQLEQWL